MNLSDKQKIFAFNIHRLIEFAFKNGFELTFGEVVRPMEQVWLNFYGYQIVNNGGLLSLEKKTPTSKTLDSRHPQRLAADFNIFINGQLINDPIKIQPLGEFWISLNTDNVWGGDWNRDHSTLDEKFKDPYHFEMKP